MARERGGIPSETLMGLRRRLAALPRRDSGRRAEVGRIAELFGVSSSTVYRALASSSGTGTARQCSVRRFRVAIRTSFASRSTSEARIPSASDTRHPVIARVRARVAESGDARDLDRNRSAGSWRQLRPWSWWTSVMAPLRVYVKGSGPRRPGSLHSPTKVGCAGGSLKNPRTVLSSNTTGRSVSVTLDSRSAT